MNAGGWIQLGLFVIVLLAITKPLGLYLLRVLDPVRAGRQHVSRSVLGPIERMIYRILRVDPKREHNWKQYAVAMLIFSGVTMLLTYGMLRLQASLPLNPQKMANVGDALAFNTATSFSTNTNWQSYGGESSMSYLSQMVALASHNFMSAGVGLCVAAALIRGIARDRSGNHRQLLGRPGALPPLPAAADVRDLRDLPRIAGNSG